MPKVFFDIINASKIGTPAELRELSVLEKLAKQDFVTKSFVIGSLSNIESFQLMNFVVLICFLIIKKLITMAGAALIRKDGFFIKLEASTNN